MDSDTYDELMFRLSKSLIEEYQMKVLNFDPERINNEGDFEESIKMILNFGGINYQILSTGLSESKNDFYVSSKIEGKSFDFFTSSTTDWLETYRIIETLNQITSWLKNGMVFRELNFDDPNNSTMIYVGKDNLQEAIRKGFPCCRGGNFGQMRSFVNWDKNFSFKVVLEQGNISNEELKLGFVSEFNNLAESGFVVPIYTPEQVYLCDLFDDNQIWFCINGAIQGYCDVKGGSVFTTPDLNGLVLANVLVNKYKGIPVLLDGTSKEEKYVNKKQYKQMINSALSKKRE